MNKYPRLCLLALCFLAAYVLYHVGMFDWLGHRLNGHGYASVFLGGLLFSFGFTSPFGIAIFVEMAPEVNPFLAAPLAGLGAVISDLLIFDILRFSAFNREIRRLRSSHLLLWIHEKLHHEGISERIRRWMLWSFAGIIIASPLPDEFGVSIVSGISKIPPRQFALICFTFNTVGVFLMLVMAGAALR